MRHLEHISTFWPALADPVKFTMRYASAIERYLKALLRDSHEAEEALQDFLLRGLERGFLPHTELTGRFRDYLKAAVRNAAIDRQRRGKCPQQGDFDLSGLPMLDDEADREWAEEWRQCVLARVWEALYTHQKRSPGNLAHTVLRLAADLPEADSTTLADRASKESGQVLTPTAYRKQLSRARMQFRELLIAEIRRTLQSPSRERIQEELAALGLLSYMSEHLDEED